MAKNQLRVVVDTNIFISFLINKDFSKLDRIIIEEEAILLFSKELMEELIAVIERPKFKKIISAKDKVVLFSF